MRNTKYIKAMLKHSALYAIAMALVCGTKAWGDDFKQLSDLQIKRLVEGKLVTDDVHYTDYFNTDGSYEGVFMNKRIGGHWKIGNGQLCVVRAREPPDCDEIWRSGAKLQRRKAGLSNVRDEIFVRPK